MKELDKIIGLLRNYKPDLHDRYKLEKDIIKSINTRKSLPDIIFGWADIVWLRRSLAVASLLIIAVFVIQQSVLINRIDKLEDRVTGFNTEMILDYQRENVRVNAVMMENQGYSMLSDSINIARDDLLKLLKEYRDLQTRYEDMLNKKMDGEQENSEQKL